MKLKPIKETSEDTWTIHVNGATPEDFELDTRGQVYKLIRAARLLGFRDDSISVSRSANVNYSFEGD